MSYTFTQKSGPVAGLPASNFGSLANDANRNAMAGVLGGGPSTSDATGTPQTSPISVSSSAVTTLVIPLNAAQVNIFTTTNTINVSEADSSVASKYFTIPTGVQVTIDTARCGVLYLKANTGAATVSFWFNTV